MRTLVIGLAALLLVPAGAAAKSGVELNTRPDGLRAGDPWVVEMTAIERDGPASIPRGTHLAIEIDKVGTGERQVFPAHPIRGGAYRAKVVFPSRGTWSYQVTGFHGEQYWDRVVILPAVSEPSKADRGGGFPLGWIAAIAAIALALGLFFERRRAGRRRRSPPEVKGSGARAS
jgi:hypothetical protein